MTRGRERVGLAVASVMGVGLPVAALAGVASVTPDRDNTLYQDADGALSNGAGDSIFAGRTLQLDEPVPISTRRGLVRFDLRALPSNAVVNSASVSMHSIQARTNSALFLHRAQADWGEGTSNAAFSAGQGAPSTPGDATWIHRFYDSQTWATPGGDFAETASASSSVFFGPFTFTTTPQLSADVQDWIANPATNFGWVVRGVETSAATSKRIASREHPTASQRPTLSVDYSTSTWKTAGGNWSANSNWDFGVPDAVGAEANLSFTPVPAVVVAVNLDGPRTLGTLNFNVASAYSLSGSQLTLDRAVGRSAINVTNGGSHQITAAVHLNRDTDVDVVTGGALTLVGDLTASAGVALRKAGGGTLTVKNVRAASLTVDGGTVAVAPNGGSAGVSRVQSLTVPQGRLHLNDNDLLVDYTGPSVQGAIRQLVKDGRSLGTGITTSTTPANDTVLAVADNADLNRTSWLGQSIDTSTVIAKYTYFGDANLDGAVTGDDYLAVDAGLGIGNDWIEGDFNMDGAVTGDDYLAIDANLGKGTPTPLAFVELKAEMVALHAAQFGDEYLTKLATIEANGFGTFVPEPSGAALLAVVALGIARRRRRR